MPARWTPFGKAIKILQIEYEVRPAELAAILNVMPSRIYAVLSGQKPIPPNWPEKISDGFNMTESDRVFLRNAVDATPCKLSIDAKTPLQAEVAHAFVAAMPDLSEAELEKLKRLLRRGPPRPNEAARRKDDVA